MVAEAGNDTFESSGKKGMFSIPPGDLSFGQVRLKFVRISPGDSSYGVVPFYDFHIIMAEEQEASDGLRHHVAV